MYTSQDKAFHVLKIPWLRVNNILDNFPTGQHSQQQQQSGLRLKKRKKKDHNILRAVQIVI